MWMTVIYNDTWEEHIATTIRKLFSQLQQANLTVNLAKSEFGKAAIKNLGHILGYGKISPQKVKVNEIGDYPAQRNELDIRRFLGVAGYYRRLCPRFSNLAVPLTELLKKKNKFQWIGEFEKSSGKF